MNKQQYLTKLAEELKSLPENEKNEMVADIEEHFAMGIKKGRTEAQIAEKLGDPKKIAKDTKAYNAIEIAESKTTIKNTTRAVFATIGLSFFNLVFVIGPFLGVVGTLIGFMAGSIAMVLAGFVAAILSIFSPVLSFVDAGPLPIASFLASIGIASLGGAWTILNYYLFKWFFKLTINYLKLNISIVERA